MKPTFYRILEDCPVIAAVKDDQALEASLRSPCQIIFVLYGDICNVGGRSYRGLRKKEEWQWCIWI